MAWKYDVVIVGAGPAGITAAIALAKAEIPVLVIEAGVFPGAENWSGAVYFTENLAQPDVLGDQAVRDSAYERPVARRGFYLYNGHSLAGLSYRNPDTFANCYTVLRPTYDHYLAELAKSFGATILTETTADGLLRDETNRIVGVHTDRGPVYADVVFLAEGDASQLVTKEGYERVGPASSPAPSPHFLQGIKEVIEVDPDSIERVFDLRRGEGAAYEILLRNGSIHNRTVHLNMGGFLYTNKASLSLGLVLPLDNLSTEFGGDHNRLMEWFKGLPEVRRWTNNGRSVAYGAKIIRGGGFRELPQLVDDGLAIGGAATGIGLDFPYPNFTGPATAMGRLFARAVREIRATDKVFSRARLEELYEVPLRETHYFKNVEFLENWPHYIEHTRVFFSRFVDLKCGSLYIASHPTLRAHQKLWQLAKFARETLPLQHWGEFVRDLREQRQALGLDRVVGAPFQARPAEGEIQLDFRVDGEPRTRFPWPISGLFVKAPAMLSAAADHLYRNDATPLPHKLRNAIRAFRRQLGLLDVLAVGLFALLLLLLAPIQWLCELIKLIVTRPSPEKFLSSFYQKYRALVRERTQLDSDAVKVHQPWEEKLALIRYSSETHSHIKVFRPENFENRTKIAESPLWHVCPARVYENKVDDLGQVQIIVNFENCIKCETCWRAAPSDVDWTRQRQQRLIFSAPTEANRKLLELLKQNRVVGRVPSRGEMDTAASGDAACNRLTIKLRQYCETVYAEPRYIDAGRARWLQSLLEDAQSAAADLGDPRLGQQLARIVGHAKHHRFFWAEADARQLLELPEIVGRVPSRGEMDTAASGDAAYKALCARLDKLFPRQAIKDLEHGKPFSPEQMNFLKLLADAASPPRSAILRELGRRDPSLAALVSGVYSAQVAEHPELGEQPWIGLTAARAAWKDFVPERKPTLEQVGADMCAIALGAGELLLERCRAHATGRVQFPGLFKDEDGRDGIAKFGAVKQLLSEMEAQVRLLEALLDFVGQAPRLPVTAAGDAPALQDDAALVKILATEALGPDPGSVTYNAGQIFGGTAYSEDDVLSKFYRDSVCFPHLLYDNEELKCGIGPDAETKLRSFARNLIQSTPVTSELEAELAKMFVGAASPPRPEGHSYHYLGTKILAHGYIEAPLQNPPAFNYREALESRQEYDYGDFLVKPFDPAAWRFVPEMLHADAELRAYHERLYRHFTERYWNNRFDGLPYHRLVEKLHMVPLDDVRDMIERGFTRMYIPKEFGGEGLLKAHYYILCPLSMRYADPAYALTIMAHSSIGTTPVLLGLNQDLPRAKADLQEFLENPSAISNLQSEISRILRMLDSPEALKVKKVFTALGETVKTEIGRKPMLRAIAAGFLAHFMDAGRAGLRMDLAAFKSELLAALQSLDSLRARAEAVIAELDRRAEAHKLFLRLIAAGQISAFALTEPSAGSDSGGIQTRAVLKRVKVLTAADGVKYFMLGNERKNIIDAATLDLSKIDYGEYDYKTDDPTKFRYYQRNGKRIAIHDIAQIRREFVGHAPSLVDSQSVGHASSLSVGQNVGHASSLSIRQNVGHASSLSISQLDKQDACPTVKEFYEYYELNGAKMWITNGHVAGVMCLYARTPEGPTGFMVDRHSEGLVVGKDEEKMGQRGSPTNELGLTCVRVPRENVIGIEGRGQVNALETLNVGRMGLCVSAVAMMAKIVEQTRAFVNERGLDQEERIQQILGEMATELYGTESLAYELIGRADHHGTKSFRTESAIGKYYASEALHRIIRAAERILGIEGCAQTHELEKHRRDARVLNIYEGTNEVQRFLILRDLVDHVLPRVVGRVPARGEPEQPKTTDAASGDAAYNVETAKAMLLRDLKQAVDAFGPQVWQNASFQPTMFKLVDIAGYIKVMDSALWRALWLRSCGSEDHDHYWFAENSCEAYFNYAWGEISRLQTEFERDFSLLRQGLYPPGIRVAQLALQAQEERTEDVRRPPLHRVTGPMRVLVVLNIRPVLSPRPRVVNGELLETHFEFDAASRTALERAIELKLSGTGVPPAQPERQNRRDARSTVRVTAIAVAPRSGVELLRRALAWGADDAVLIGTDDWADDPHAAAQLVADHVGQKQLAPDLVLCGETVLAAVVAGNLGLSHFADVKEFVVNGDQTAVTIQKPEVTLTTDEPVALSFGDDRAQLDFTVEDFFAALSKPLEIIDAREIATGPQIEVRYRLPEAPPVAEQIEASPTAAAALARKIAGIESMTPSGGGLFTGTVELAEKSKLPGRDAAVFVATAETLEGIETAAACAEALMLPFHVVVLGQFDEPAARAVAARVPAERIDFASSPHLAEATPASVLAALRAIWKDTLPAMLAAGTWADQVLAQFARAFPRVQVRSNVVAVERHEETVQLISPAFGGRVQQITTVGRMPEHPLVMTVGRDEGGGMRDEVEKRVFLVPIEFEYDRRHDEMANALAAAKSETSIPSIADAEFIIDVGYAVRNKENFDLVIGPLMKRLEEIGVKNVMLGGTRKVVEELKLLSSDQQIGQTGTAVNPKLIISIGVSGAPQHIDYIGERATIIAFNKDPEAPLMTLNKRRARPKVFPIVGDLFETVPRFTAALRG